MTEVPNDNHHDATNDQGSERQPGNGPLRDDPTLGDFSVDPVRGTEADSGIGGGDALSGAAFSDPHEETADDTGREDSPETTERGTAAGRAVVEHETAMSNEGNRTEGGNPLDNQGKEETDTAADNGEADASPTQHDQAAETAGAVVVGRETGGEDDDHSRVVSPERIDAFFASIVGTPEQEAQFKDTLEAQSNIALLTGKDPYEALEENTSRLIVEHIVTQLELDPVTEHHATDWEKITMDFPAGISATIHTFQALGTVIEQNANVPQRRSVVEENIQGVIGHMYSISALDRAAGHDAIDALAVGLNPRDPNLHAAVRSRLSESSSGRHTTISLDSLAALVDNEGQVHVSIRFPELPEPVRNRECPANAARIRDVPALPILLGDIGDVALGIYDTQFRIDHDV